MLGSVVKDEWDVHKPDEARRRERMLSRRNQVKIEQLRH